jgi:Zn-dependent M28 family amino/carboxypeptidase
MVVALSFQNANGQKVVDPKMTSRVSKTIKYLASDKLEGRECGTAAEKRAAEFIAKEFKKMGLTPKGDSSWYQPYSFVPHGAIQKHERGDSTTLGMQLVKEKHTQNVIGFIDNNAPFTIIIGAHYDHLGWGDENSLFTGGRAIHNGADDNASGVACLLELAKQLSNPQGPRENNYLFIAFSGEEKGLFGSNYFTKHPTVDLSKVNYMLNMDMVGRLNAERALAINGAGTSPMWKDALNKCQPEFKQVLSESGVGPSDHTSFYLSDIPVLHFFTGQHEDYHKPSDDFEKINVAGLTDITYFIYDLIGELSGKGKMEFTKTQDQQQQAADFKVTLGVMPDYMYSGPGLKIDGAKEGRPGLKAGLQKGDIITKLGDYEVNDIYEYMDALGKFEKGQSCDMQVMRDGKPLTLRVVWE